MSEEVGHGHVTIELDDRASRDLARLEREFDATMDKIDREQATVDIRADVNQLKRDLKAAEAELKKFQGVKDKHLTESQRAEKRAAQESRRIAEERVAWAERDARLVKERGDQAAIQSKRQQLYAKREQAAQRIFEQNERRNLQVMERRARVSASLHQQQLRELSAAERAAHSMNQEFERTPAAIAKGQQRILKLRQEMAKLDRDARKISTRSSPAARQRVEIDRTRALAEMTQLKAELNRLGATPPVEIDVDIEGDSGWFTRLAKTITETTVRVGPFTTTIAGLTRTMAYLGPVIIGLIGQVAAFASVLGAGLTGAVGVASASFVGFAGAALGITAIVKPLIGDFMDAKKATDAYNKAVREHGEGSDQAAKKMKVLQNVLGDVPAKTREQFTELGNLGDRWRKLTASARPEFFKLMGEGIQTASDIMPMFARRSTQAFKAVSSGLQGWMKGLRSASGQGILDTILGNFNKAIPSLMKGLGALGAAFGRVAASFSKLLPDLGRGFNDWAQGLNNSAKNTSRLDRGTRTMVDAMRSVGSVVAAAGRVLIQFVRAGTGPGTSMLEGWADGLNRLARSMATVQGQAGLRKFFQDSITAANNFWGAIKPLAQLFYEWTTILGPFVNAALEVVRVLSSLVEVVAGLGVSRLAIQAFFGAFLIRGAIGRIREAALAIRSLAAAQGALTAATVVSGRAMTGGLLAGGLAGGAAGRRGRGPDLADSQRGAKDSIAKNVAAGAAGGAAANNAGKAMSKAAKAGGLLSKALRGIGGAVGIAHPAVGALAIGVGVAALAFSRGKSSATKAKEAFEDAGKNANTAAAAYHEGANVIGDLASGHQRAEIQLRAANKALRGAKKGTDEYRLAQMNVRDAQREVHRTSAELNSVNKGMLAATEAQVHAESDKLEAFDKVNERSREMYQQDLKNAHSAETRRTAEIGLANIAKARAPLEAAAERAANRHAAANLNVERGMRGMIPTVGRAEQALGKLVRTNRGLATRIALKFDAPKDVGRVAAGARAALKSGASQTIVTKIVADASSATAAVKAFQALVKGVPESTVSYILAETKGRTQVLALRAAIAGVPGRTIARILGTTSGEERVTALRALIAGVPARKVAQITARASGAEAVAALNREIAALRNRSVRIETRRVNIIENRTETFNTGGGGGARRQRARGRGPIGRERALIGEGRGPEIVADHASGRMRLVRSPMFMDLRPTEAVIPTEPAFRGRGANLLADFAKSMGIPGFKGGRDKKNKPATRKQRRGARAKARKRAPKKQAYVSRDNVKLQKVEALKTQEEDQARRISIEQSKLVEPDSFIKETGTDPLTGEPTYAVDQGAIDHWHGELTRISGMFQDLMDIIKELGEKTKDAITHVKGIVTNAARNMKIVGGSNGKDGLIGVEDRIIKDPKVSRAGKDMARERKAYYQQVYQSEKNSRDNAIEDRDKLNEDAHDIPFRWEEAQVERDSLKSEAASLAGKAAEDAASANPKPPRPEDPGPADPFEAGNAALGKLDAEEGLAGIGQGLMGGAPRSLAEIAADRIAANQGIIDTARGMLADDNPGNDAAAYSAIASASGNIAGITGSTTANAAAALADRTTFSSSRGDLYRSFGSNFASGGAAAAGFMGSGGRTAMGANPAASGGIHIVNNFQTQPDPHTWSQGVAWEVQGAL